MGARVYLASIARFTSLDPVAGGTANNYVYALDPISFSDYSGNCILQCTGGSSLQGSTRIVQGSSPAIQGGKAAVQTTISSQRLQGTRATTIVFRMQKTMAAAKPAAKTYDNSTARAVATISSVFNRIEKRISEGNISVEGSIGFPVSVGAGRSISKKESADYMTMGASLKPGVGASATYSLSGVSHECTLGLSAFFFVGFSISLDGSWAVGVGTPGVSIETSCPLE